LRGWFAPSFGIPVAGVGSILRSIKEALGALQGVSVTGGQFDATFERGELQGRIEFDGEGRFTRLDLDIPRARRATLEETIATLRDLPGHVSVFVADDGADRIAIDADRVQHVGTAAWLAILSAVSKKVGATGDWSRTLSLKESLKSAGVLGTWPDGAPLTLFSLAALMNVQHDPTAADTLLDWVGRAAVERQAPESRPFPSAREALTLEAPENADLRERYANGDERERRAVVEALGTRAPPAPGLTPGPRRFGHAWQSTARRLCDQLRQVHDLAVMAIRRGPESWDNVAHADGADGDLASQVSWLTASGRNRCVSAIWESPQIVPGRLAGLHAQLIGALGVP
jgi:hypothetical protein